MALEPPKSSISRKRRDLDSSILKMVASAAEHRNFVANSVLFSSGDARDFFYVVIEGDLEVRIESGDAEGTIVVLGPGEGVGEAVPQRGVTELPRRGARILVAQ